MTSSEPVQDGTGDSYDGIRCDCCELLLPIGTRAKVDRETGAIICLDCCADLASS